MRKFWKKTKKSFENHADLNRNNRHGFTLVEMLVIIIIVSVLLSVLVPLMTKRNPKKINTDKEKIGTTKLWPIHATIPDEWLECDGRVFDKDKFVELYEFLNNSQVLPKIESDKAGMMYIVKVCHDDCYASLLCDNVCQSDEYQDLNCDCNSCSEKYGQNCKTCTLDNCVSCSTQCFSDETVDPTDECKCKFTTRNCRENSGIVIKGVCVKKYNVGDLTDSNWKWSKIRLTGIGNAISQEHCLAVGNCCFQGITAANLCTPNETYSACTRTLCQQSAAYYACNNIGWRLPSAEEMSQWGATNTSGYLNLCGTTQNATLPYCGATANCLGSSATNICEPYRLWSDTSGISYAYQGTWASSTQLTTVASSVRCVKDITSEGASGE